MSESVGWSDGELIIVKLVRFVCRFIFTVVFESSIMYWLVYFVGCLGLRSVYFVIGRLVGGWFMWGSGLWFLDYRDIEVWVVRGVFVWFIVCEILRVVFGKVFAVLFCVGEFYSCFLGLLEIRVFVWEGDFFFLFVLV